MRCSVLGILLTMAPIAAQQPPKDPVPPAPASGQGSADVHSEARSRELFTACDGDSDDRLDLFEASEAFENLGDPKDPSGFRRLDRDRDGYVTWPEFDSYFRSVVQHGATFRVRTCRRLVQQAPEQLQAQPASPLQKFLQLYDENRNGGLDPKEIDRLVRQENLPPAAGAQMKALDLDHSGRVEETELAPLFERLRANQPSPPVDEKAGGKLPPPWHAIDSDADGRIDVGELANALRRIDPGLARWAPQLLKACDKDRNGTLDASELPGAGPGPGPAKVRTQP